MPAFALTRKTPPAPASPNTFVAALAALTSVVGCVTTCRREAP
jgi:hypothetical protein